MGGADFLVSLTHTTDTDFHERKPMGREGI